MFKKLLFFIICLGLNRAYAQFNDTTHYHVNLNATGSVNETDGVGTYLLNNALNMGYKSKTSTFNLSNTYVYGKSNKLLTNNDFSSTLFYNLYETIPHFYYWGLVNYNTSYSLKINNEVQAGAGGAYSVLDKKNAYINLSDGVLYDKNDLTNLNYHTYRNSFRLQLHFNIKDIVTLDGTHFLQNSFSRGDDYIVKSTTTLGLKLRKWISLTTTYTYNKMNITHSDNSIFTYGVAIDKYF